MTFKFSVLAGASTGAENFRLGIDPGQLRGTIVCIPVQHQLALVADHCLPLAQLLKLPLDQMSPGA